jgi:RNA polymerase sigma factor (sigma-70 family)
LSTRRHPGAYAIAVADRDEEFLGEFETLHRRAYQAAYRLCGDREVSEDIAQETLTRAYTRWSRLDDRREGWVVTTATRIAIGRWRREERFGRIRSARSEPEPIESAVVTRLDLVRLLSSLPKRQREVAVLRFLEDRSEAEVARLLRCSAGTVKQHTTRALTKMRSTLDRGLARPIERTDQC